MAKDSLYLNEEGVLLKQSVLDFLNITGAHLQQLTAAMMEVSRALIRSGDPNKAQLGMNATNLTAAVEIDIEDLKRAIIDLPT